MKTRTSAVIVSTLLFVVCSASAEFSVWDKGIWPETWPAELEPLRKQARTFEGPVFPTRLYLIPFNSRQDFEASWPHLLKLKTKGAPIILMRGPRTDFFAVQPGGVMVHSPAAGTGQPEAPLSGEMDARSKWEYTTYLELIVDGSVVDLNRIPLPRDTPIVDERFKDEKR